MEKLIGLVLVVAVVVVVLRLTGRHARRGGRRFKCHDCRHLRKTFDDGVMCSYGTREVFKTRAHISMCPDWEQRLRDAR